MAISLPEGSFSALIFDCDGTVGPIQLRPTAGAAAGTRAAFDVRWMVLPAFALAPMACLMNMRRSFLAPHPAPTGIFERYNVVFSRGFLDRGDQRESRS